MCSCKSECRHKQRALVHVRIDISTAIIFRRNLVPSKRQEILTQQYIAISQTTQILELIHLHIIMQIIIFNILLFYFLTFLQGRDFGPYDGLCLHWKTQRQKNLDLKKCSPPHKNLAIHFLWKKEQFMRYICLLYL